MFSYTFVILQRKATSTNGSSKLHFQKNLGPALGAMQISQTAVCNTSVARSMSILSPTHSFGTPDGTKTQASMLTMEFDLDNIIKTNMEDLFEEQKKQVNDKVELYRDTCLDCFATPRGGKAIQKMQFPGILMQGETTVTASHIDHEKPSGPLLGLIVMSH
jgi:hypothetical protein